MSQLKERIRDELGIEISMQRLIFCGRVMQDHHLLSEYGKNQSKYVYKISLLHWCTLCFISHVCALIDFLIDVDGKVVHLVQRAPPSPQRRSSSQSGPRDREREPRVNPGIRHHIRHLWVNIILLIARYSYRYLDQN